MGMRRLLCLVAGCGLFLSACPSFSNLKTARALDQGEFQFTIAPAAGVVSVPQASGATGELGSTLPLAQFELAARVGITDGFDLGLKLWVAGAGIDSTISLLRGGFDLALAPGVGFTGFSITEQDDSGANQNVFLYEVPVYLPLLAGVNFGAGHQFVFGVEAISVFSFGGTSSTDTNGVNGSASSVELFLGGTLGVSFKLGSSFRIMPEFSLFAPVAGASTFGSGSIQAFGNSGSIIFQGGLAFSFGGDGFNKHPSWVAAPPM